MPNRKYFDPSPNTADFIVNRTIFLLITGSFFLLTAFCWLYKLDTLPGLHGDEAWSGIEANYLNHHSLDRINGMNNYTGILQAVLAKVVFRYFGISVFNLRIGGVIANLAGLAILVRLPLRYGRYGMGLMFMLLLGQSALYLTSARIAWEVNSFTMIFLAILFSAAEVLLRAKSHLSAFVFLCVSLLGSYNHIIFSTVPFSILVGLCLWSVYNSDTKYIRLMTLSAFSLANTFGLFILMHFFQKPMLSFLNFPLLIIWTVILTECYFVERLSGFFGKLMSNIPPCGVIIKTLLIISIAAFILFHGRALFDVLSGYKLFLQVYSYETLQPVWLILSLCALVFLGFLSWFLWEDLEKQVSLLPFLIIAYLGVLNLYTTETSLRYYLILYTVLSLYMAFKISTNLKRSIMLIPALTLTLCINTAIQGQVLAGQPKPVRAVNFEIGNGQRETSAHFLPKETMVDFLKRNRVGHVDVFNENPYFLLLPVQFYQLQCPWAVDQGKRTTVDYDYTAFGSGYRLYLEH